MKKIVRSLLLTTLALSSSLALIAFQDAGSSSTPADNTTVNQRDRNKSEPTADQQKNNKADLETTRQIRKALVADKSLSTYAHNVKVVTQNGKVTLKGPVRSDDEKKAVEAKAVEVAGAGNVTNQLAVAKAKVKKNA